MKWKMAAVWLIVLLIALAIVGVAQRLPPGPIVDRSAADETETIQAGGHGWGVFSQVGNLRCQGAQQAIVGVRTRRGSALDYLQIVCAPIQCAGANCSWNQYLSQGSAGNPSGGQTSSLLICQTNEAMSGYRATVKNFVVKRVRMEYVEDVEIECAKIAGPAGSANAVPVQANGRHWIYGGGHLAPSFGAYLNKPGVCPNNSASAVSFAVGHYGITQANVVQAMSLFCANWNNGSCPAGISTNFTPLAPLYNRTAANCPECCKRCVVLQGSANPVTGRTDQEVGNLPVQRYNCNFYTLSYMNYVTPPGVKGRVPRQFDQFGGFERSSTTLREADMLNYGWTKAQTLRPGDVVSFGPANFYEHTAVVIQATANNIVLRQKPNPFACVTDFTWQEAAAFFPARPITIWHLNKP